MWRNTEKRAMNKPPQKAWTRFFPHSESESCSGVSDSLRPMDYIVHGIFQARILERVLFPFSRGSSQSRDQTQVICIAGRFFTSWATMEASFTVLRRNWSSWYLDLRLPGSKLLHNKFLLLKPFYCLSVVFCYSFSDGTVAKNPPVNAGYIMRCGFDTWVRKIPWRRAWQPTSVFLPGESHEQRSLVGYSP